MKTRIIILLAVIGIALLIAGLALARTHTAAAATAPARYHLNGSPWQPHGVSTGGEYRLASSAGPSQTGNGCCCTFIPCMRR